MTLAAAPLGVPVLETERLILRGHSLEDFAASAAMSAEPEVVRYTSGRPGTAEETWRRILQFAGLWATFGYGYWAVCAKDGGRFVGEVGFGNFHRDTTPPLGDAPEAGWILSAAAHGRGYATEAMTAAHAWADAQFGGARTVCLIAPENAPSLRVAQKLGYREFARTTYKEAPALLLER